MIKSDVIREWQAKHLYDQYKLTNLYIFRHKVSKSFDNQILATFVRGSLAIITLAKLLCQARFRRAEKPPCYPA